MYVGSTVLLVEWAAALIRGGLPSVSPTLIVEAWLIAAACCFVGAMGAGLVVHAGRSVLRRLGTRLERFMTGGGICVIAGLGVALEAMAASPKLGVPVYGQLGLGQPWQPGLVMAVVLAAIAVGLAVLGFARHRGHVVTLLTAIIWLHLAVGPGYLDMAARVTPRRHLLLVALCLVTLDLVTETIHAGRQSKRLRRATLLAIPLAVCVWAAAPWLASNDAKLIVGGRTSVPYRMLALSAAAPWAPEKWHPIADPPRTKAIPLVSQRLARPSRGVVLVIIDTLRPDALDWQSNGQPLAPNLLGARRESLSWSRAYATYPGTGLSGAAMLGRTSSPSLLTSLRAQGVRSVAVSTSGALLAPDFDETDDSARTTEMTSRMVRYSDRTTAAALRNLDLLMEGEELFLLLVHYMAPHAPYVGNRSAIVPPLDRYRDEVAYVDEALAPLLRRLKEGVDAGDVTVVVASDHGEEFLEHGYRTHGVRLYEESMRIVLFMSGPGVRARQSSAPVSGADLAPTLAELLGVSGTERTSGHDERREVEQRVIRVSGSTSFGCIRGAIKWIYDVEVGYWERYDLISDPEESMNGAGDHDVPEWCGRRNR
ncbi:MAG: sulfatase-like hydrolase/transferase [Deltaproteobacteria bacterium]|nr:sulfatase-like hydrolase/transferase [Deltaproteobacteria bacterium]